MELDVAQAALLGPGEGERLGEHIVVKIERPEISVNEVVRTGPFEGAGPHFHKEHVDVFYVLEGELEVINGTETVRAGPGYTEFEFAMGPGTGAPAQITFQFEPTTFGHVAGRVTAPGTEPLVLDQFVFP